MDLSDEEWRLLFQGVHQLRGPTAIDDAVARVIGYRNAAELWDYASTLVALVKAPGSTLTS